MSERLRIGLLQCGYVHPSLTHLGGDYPEAFARLLGPQGVDLVTYDVQQGPVPPGPGDHDGWLVSGSASSTYEDLAWIPPIEGFLRDVVDAEVPLVAVCFGHQLLAQALGGTVARAEAGWGVGVHRYDLVGEPLPWMDPPPADSSVHLVASHQDQVVALPDGAEIWAVTEHCPVAGYTLGSRALTIQPHPEFGPALSRGLLDVRRERIGADVADAALATLDEPLDADLVAAWFAAFWRS